MIARFIGDGLLARDGQGRLRTRIATVFPQEGVIVTVAGIHATQRVAYTDMLDAERLAANLPPLDDDEQEAIWLTGVDLVIDDEAILIRPDPADMGRAFEADELLQQLYSKKQIKFLHVLNERVREAIQQRGECWRISPLPRSPDEMARMISGAKIGIGGRDIYYYNTSTGTRLLTCHDFARLGELSDEELLRHLVEIREYSARRNRMGNPEIDFFMAEGTSLFASLAAQDFSEMDGVKLRSIHRSMVHQFQGSVPAEFRLDDLENARWRSAMYAALIGQSDKAVSEEALLGLSAEFFMQVAWVPGGRIESGELIFDSVFEEEDSEVCCPVTRPICDFRARALIFNFIRDFGDLEYVNIGRVAPSISHHQAYAGHRGVYLAEIKQRGIGKPLLHIIRMQKRGVWQCLDQGADLLDAILDSETYTEHILDRRLACRQLGMNLPAYLTSRKLCERYKGSNEKYKDQLIWSTYFERDYVQGLATDKIPAGRFSDDAFAMSFARVLGRAAAPNLIVARSDARGVSRFDDGDELLIEDSHGLPVDIVVTDHTGTFSDCARDLPEFIPAYAASVRKRSGSLSDERAFAEVFVHAFSERLLQIQAEYHKRKRAFDTLFHHQRPGETASFRERWRRALERLAAADPRALTRQLREDLRL